MVEYFSDELINSQLQEVITTEEGLVLSFYRFNKNPKICHLLFDLDKLYPFCCFFEHNPWIQYKKIKPISLFLNAHARNHNLINIEISEDLGRVIKLNFDESCQLEFRLIPKQTNLLVTKNKKIISWYPVKILAQNDLKYTKIEAVDLVNQNGNHDNSSEIRSISYMTEQWLRYKGGNSNAGRVQNSSPFEKWKKNKEKDLSKKKKALVAVQDQIDKLKVEEWSLVGEYLKIHGLRNIKPEWSIYINFEKSVSSNIQNCFDKAKLAKIKIKGAQARLSVLRHEIKEILELTNEKYEDFLNQQNLKKIKAPIRQIEGRLRKIQIEESNIVAYMGKSARDNLDLLRRSKPYDLWLHLKDYPSAHAIIHKEKEQKVSDSDIFKIAAWLIKEGLSEKKRQLGGKFLVVLVECRYVKPLKGDKLGRVTYQKAREILIAV